MELEIHIQNQITKDDITKALSFLRNDETFLILHKSELEYIQVNGVTMEYQDGSLDFHYYCPDKISNGLILDVLSSYAYGDDWWRTAVRWEQMSNGLDF